MTGDSHEVSKNPIARAPEVGGNALRGLLEAAINGTSVVPGAKSAAAKHLLKKEKQAALVIYIASPTTTNQLCQPADVESKWNCRVGDRVVLNSDRWRFMTPTYDDLGAYRSYLVNHEVGHYLGQGHVGCPKAGNKAPVMMQQSIDLAGCSPNAWPKDAD